MTVDANRVKIPEDILRELEEHDAQVVVERGGEPVAILVSPRFLKVFQELAEELENRLDYEAYLEAKQEFVKSGEAAVPYDEVRKELGL